MNRLGDAPTDLLFGLIALHNDFVAPAVIPAAFKAAVHEPGWTLAERLVAQGALSTSQRDLVQSLSAEYIKRNGGDAEKTLAELLATPSPRERLNRIGDPDLTGTITEVATLGSTIAADANAPSDDLDYTLPPADNAPAFAKVQIAGYEILGVLGVGGMGVVYKARQPRLERFVALKMIRAGASARPEDITRFESEAKAVAAIEHANIVKIHDIGEHEGLPYFSLEYLAGGSLASKIGGKPQPFDEGARIVETLARAMYVAHENKVIHRDLKPTNVLFTADGTLKITDFGLVKRLEADSGQTRSGSILGTPSYMAPEQARGESQNVGPAADQYALGAILYELLTGRPPFQGTSVLDTLDMVRSKEPVPPSQLQPKTPRDLETICLKCLEKDIERRYPDVLALAEDLRKFQTGQTILARPVSEVERLGRWCLRNRRVAALSGLVALLVLIGVVGLAIATVMFGQKNLALSKSSALAEEKRKDAEIKEKKAVAAARAANAQNRSAVDAHIEMISLLQRQLRFVPVLQNLREGLLDKASTRLEAAAEAMANLRREVDWAPEDEQHNWRSLARAHQAQGNLSLSRNQITQGMAQLRKAEEINDRLAAADPGNRDLQVNLIRSKRQLGYNTMDQLLDTEGSQKYHRRAVELSRRGLAKDRDSDVFKSELANSLGGLARSEVLLGHLEKARDFYREEIALRESFSTAESRTWESRREFAGHYAAVAALNVQTGDPVEAQRLYDKCARIREQTAAEKPDSWPAQNDLALSYNNQGTIRFTQSHDQAAAADARKFHLKALEILRKRAKSDPQDSDNKKTLAETLNYEATSALAEGDKAGAAASFRECLEIRQELAKAEPTAKKLQADLMLALARCGKDVEAARIAKSLVATPPQDEYLYVVAAGGYALAAGAAAGDDAKVKSYTALALDCLRKAKDRGWAVVAILKSDTDFEPIRNDPAFQALLRDLERAGKK
jgi:eukaryotic-like serine/threonine-protein kinase